MDLVFERCVCLLCGHFDAIAARRPGEFLSPLLSSMDNVWGVSRSPVVAMTKTLSRKTMLLCEYRYLSCTLCSATQLLMFHGYKINLSMPSH